MAQMNSNDWLRVQYQQAAEECRHEDRLSWQVFFAALAANGIIATLLAGTFGDPERLPILYFVGSLGIIICISSILIILRSFVYLSHRSGILREIEEILRTSITIGEPLPRRLYTFKANDSSSHSKYSDFYLGKNPCKLCASKFGGRNGQFLFLSLVAVGWLVFMIWSCVQYQETNNLWGLIFILSTSLRRFAEHRNLAIQKSCLNGLQVQMDKEEIVKAIKRRELEDSLEQRFLATLDDRISRYQEHDFIELTPNAHFAPVSAGILA